MPQERLQKIIAQAGITSRRAAEELIDQGRVTVNGQPATIGSKADPAIDLIRVDGELLKITSAPLVYMMLNKPPGVVSAARAQRQEKRRTVLDLVPVEERVYPVGRLDADSEGLILLTNDGSLTQRLTHPRYGHMKTYHVLVYGYPEPTQLELWAAGVLLDDGPTAPCEVHIDQRLDNFTWLEVKMREGRKRQIRRTAGKVGLRVKRLVRVQLGPLSLGDLKVGAWRSLTDEEVRALKASRPAAGGKPRATGPAAARLKAGLRGRGKPGPKAASGGRKPTGRKPTSSKLKRARPATGKPTAGRPPRREAAEDESTERPARGGKPTGRKPRSGKPMPDAPASHEPAEDSTTERPTRGGKPSGRKSPGGKPGGGKPRSKPGSKPGSRRPGGFEPQIRFDVPPESNPA